MSDDFFASLNAEIATIVSTAATRTKAAEARKKANNPRLSTEARQRAAAEFSELSAIIEKDLWIPTTVIALFTEQSCDGCGSVHRVFLQYMELQTYRTKPSTQRYVRAARPTDTLPREVLIQPHRTHLCADCCEDHGFAIFEASYLAPREAVAPSFTYHQEDVNAHAA